ncbi:MAG: hypothetical protein IRY85_18935 [Micromonosporaceae bacterium]|nr:hypothetical protein [Micromonosporaceae bacterium]
MPELDEDALRAALRDLYESALPLVRPPGVDAVQRRIRRRTATGAAALAMTAMAAVVTIVLTLPLAIRGPLPNDTPTPSTTSATATITRSPRPTDSPNPTVSSEPDQATTCDSNPRVGASYTKPIVRFWLYSTTGDPICAGVEKSLTWVSFKYLEDGRQVLHGGATWPVRPGNTYSDEIPIDPTCQGDIYIAAGSFMVTELSPGMHHPFPMASAQTNWEGTVFYEIVTTNPCPEAPSASPSTSMPSSPPPV